MTRISRLLALAVILALALVACGPQAPTAAPTVELPTTAPTEAGPRTLAVMTHDSFAVSDSVLQEFEQANDVKVQILKSGDAGAMLNTAILNKQVPLADVLYGVDNTLLSRALDNDLFEPYDAPGLASIPADLRLDPENRALPVDYGDVCLNYDKAYFAEKGLTPPANIGELTKPEYKGLLVTEDPATSSPGLAFMLATWAAFGDDGFRQYWTDLRANEVKVVADWETAYYTEFSGSSGKGPRPIVVSYASSPPAEVVFASIPLDDAPTASVTGAKSCFRQIEFVGILKGTHDRDLAQAWVDFMLSRTFQEDMPLNMFVYPVQPSATLPEAFVKYSGRVEAPVVLDANTIAENRDRLIREWTEIVVR